MYRRMTAGQRTQTKAAVRARDANGGAMRAGDRRSASMEADASSMKTCPVCHARCFADMEVCYGCLHSFADDEGMRRCDDDAGDSPIAVPDTCADAADSIGCGLDVRIADVTLRGCDGPAGEGRYIPILDLVIGIRMAQDAHERALARSALQADGRGRNGASSPGGVAH